MSNTKIKSFNTRSALLNYYSNTLQGGECALLEDASTNVSQGLSYDINSAGRIFSVQKPKTEWYQIRYKTNNGRTINFDTNKFGDGYSIVSNVSVGENEYLCTFNKPITELKDYFAYIWSELVEMTLPDSVNKIGNYCFYYINPLVNVILPKTLASVGNASFNSIDNVSAITIPEELQTVGGNAFKTHSSVINYNAVNCDFGVTSDYNYCFNTNYITEVNFGDKVEVLPWGFMKGAYQLTGLTFNEGLRIVGRNSFRDCTGITSLELPSTVKELHEYCFAGCSISALTLNEGLQVMKIYNFSNNFMSAVTIPSTVVSIDEYCFRDNSNLVQATFLPTTPPSFKQNVFQGCNNLAHIYVPAASVDTYKAASGFSSYANKIEAIPE